MKVCSFSLFFSFAFWHLFTAKSINMAMAAASDVVIGAAVDILNRVSGNRSSSIVKPAVNVGERIVYLGTDEPELGTIRWIGHLPEISQTWAAGIELDNPVGSIDGHWGNQHLFSCHPNHGMVVDLNALIKEDDFMDRGTDNACISSGAVFGADVDNRNSSDDENNNNSLSDDENVSPHQTEDAQRRQKMTLAEAASMPSTPTNTTVGSRSSRTDAAEYNGIHELPIKRLLRRLETCISKGELEGAAELARELAQLKIKCTMTQNRSPAGKNVKSDLILNMFVEDKVSHHGPIPIQVNSVITVGELKDKIFREFEFPTGLQKWILGNKLAVHDDWTLSQYGIITDGCPVFLYLLTADNASLTASDLHWDNEVQHSNISNRRTVSETFQQMNRVGDVGSSNLRESINLLATETKPDQQELVHLGWECPTCTLMNLPTRPGCEACGSSRPEDYRVPDGYKLRDVEKKILELDQTAEREYKRSMQEAEEKVKAENLQNYLHLMQLEEQDLVTNDNAFDCNVCFAAVGKHEGVKLRDCLHLFCRDCLANVITYSEEATVKCPYRDDDYACDSVLQEREIRMLVPQTEFERHLQKGVNIAENQAQNSFHCKTADCKGWCYFDDDVNEFPCPVCGHKNCLTCQVIHEGQNCRQYQDGLNSLADNNNEDARKTKQAFEDMVKNGEALHCPGCNIIIMKKWGCDWICCTYCKFEICWVTKGPRWGPAGKGDNTGGCKCGFNGVRCHPKCNYCH